MRCLPSAVLAAVLALLAPTLAHAGYCIDSTEQKDPETALLKVASGKRDKDVVLTASGGLWCIINGPGDDNTPTTAKVRDKRIALVTKACSKIIPARDKAKKEAAADVEDAMAALARDCARHLVQNAVPVLGDHDLFADVTGGKYSWYEPPPYEIVATSRDARARLFVLERFRAAIAEVGTQKLKGWKITVWHKHRLDALAALEKVATADDVAFLDEVIAATPGKDKKENKVVAAAQRAREAALARPAGSPP